MVEREGLRAADFRKARKAGDVARELARAVAKARDDGAFMAALRRCRNREMARIAYRDLAGWAPLGETLEAVTALADAACEAALKRARAELEARHGKPRDAAGNEVGAFLLGMGKLGGRELNFSSDIDLICGYGAAGQTDGMQPIPNEQFFERLVQRFTRYLHERTAEGFVFRVDWMLRPFGSSGPPAMSSAAMEDYYQAHGREWERYAFIKARVVAGDREAGAALLKALQPFVYRRYLDFNAVGALRELKRKIEEEVARKDLHDNIKLGAGGIREIEFVVQAFQLMRGGQEARLRDPRLRPVLRYLGEAGYLPAESAAALDEAYVFLRRLENALQMYRDEQTHALPRGAEARHAACVGLAFRNWDALDARLKTLRKGVEAEFQRVLGEKPRLARAPALSPLWTDDADAARAALEKTGFGEGSGAVLEAVAALRQSHLVRTLSESSQHRLELVTDQLLQIAAETAAPATVAQRVLQVVAAIAGRATYLALLHDSETAREQLARLCAASPWITQLIAQSPLLLDQLLDARTLYAPPEREQMRVELDELLANVAPGDTEGAMNALRRFRQEVMLRVAAADVAKALPLVKVSDRLTWLAEVIVQKTLDLVRAELTAQFGEPRRKDRKPAAFAVIAYGKFGGIEMGYGSDLDVVFLHDCDQLAAETAGGPRKIANEVWLSRLAQRIIHWISVQTALGRAYEVDLELRPDGRRGLTVHSLAAFAEYQRQHAWTWEHQALTRARPVAGDERMRKAFAKLRAEVLMRQRDAAQLKREVRDMRARMRANLDKSREGRFDVKQGEGGLTDLEFITQYLVLRHAHGHPALVEWSDNWRQADALLAEGFLDAGAAKTLIETYRTYRAWLHACDLQQQGALAEDSRFATERAAVCDLWRRHFGD